ncbi:hypothetical protein V8F06_006472 [Rhypophila decipiens]
MSTTTFSTLTPTAPKFDMPRRLQLRDDDDDGDDDGGSSMPALPAVCFDDCNDAYLAAQATGKTPALCDRTSDFYQAQKECSDCLASDFSLGLSNHRMTNALNAMFGQYVDYCHAWRKEQEASGLTTVSTPSWFLSLLSTMSTIYVDTRTLPTLTQPITPSLPTAGVFTKTVWTTTTLGDGQQLVSTPVETVTLTGLDREVFAKTSYISRVADLPPGATATPSPSSNSTNPGSSEGASSGPSTAVIVGASVGGAIGLVIILLVLLCFVIRRRRRNSQKGDGKDDTDDQQGERSAALAANNTAPVVPVVPPLSKPPLGSELHGTSKPVHELGTQSNAPELAAAGGVVTMDDRTEAGFWVLPGNRHR